MNQWAWIGGFLALPVIGWVIDQARYRRRVNRAIARGQLEDQEATLEYQRWRAAAKPEELMRHDLEIQKKQEMNRLKETNPREWERRVQIQAAREKSEARRRNQAERTRWRNALLELPSTSTVAETSTRSWQRVHEITTCRDLESIVDFLIDDAALNPASPFVVETDCLASKRDTQVSTDRQRYYRVGEGVWQYHVERESHD
jgi:hypothetical protein